MAMITDIEEFFVRGCGRCNRFDTPDCSARLWSEGLNALRALCRDAGLDETVKWAHPCYTLGARNVALIGALKGDFRLVFFNAALMKDEEKVLERQGPNTRHPDMLRFTSAERVWAMERVIRAYLAEARGHAQAGLRAPRATSDIDLPGELVDALDGDPELAEGFERLTPGRKRSYVIVLNGIKKPETRVAKIAKLRGQILEGKGAQER